MLDPEYLESLPDKIVSIYATLEQRILVETIRKVKQVIKNSKNEPEVLRKHNSFVLLSLAKIKRKLYEATTDMFVDAAKRNFREEKKYTKSPLFKWAKLSDSAWLNRINKDGLNQVKEEFAKLDKGIIFGSRIQLSQGITKAKFRVSQGTRPAEAIKSIALNMGNTGLIIPNNGRHEKVESIVRREVLSKVNETAAKSLLQAAQELGFEHVETTAHAGARNKGTGPMNHESWQGRVFHL